MTTADVKFMRRALGAAQKGRPSPNPHVGAVLVRDGAVVATGYHARAGLAHAEVDAIRRAKGNTAGATLYVTFEPCNHTGRTGPCTEAIVAAGISRVVIGCADPAPHVAGATEMLLSHGIEVTLGVCQAEAEALVADFAKHIQTGLPWVLSKVASSLDGRIATREGDSKWITSEAARKEGHRLRDWADAVLVGVNTVTADDAELTVRHVKGSTPRRVVLDTHLRTPVAAKVLQGEARGRTLIVHGSSAENARRDALLAAGAELVCVAERGGRVDLKTALVELGKRDIVRLLVEGGGEVHGSLLDSDLIDEVAIFLAPRLIGGRDARASFAGQGASTVLEATLLSNPQTRVVGDEIWVRARVMAKSGRAG